MILTTKMKYKALLCLTVILTYYQGAAQSRAKPLNDKVQQLRDLVAKKSIIQLNLELFKYYVKSPAKPYAFFVMFTDLRPGSECHTCQHVYDEYQMVANSYRFSPLFDNTLFFGVVDFGNEGSDVFKMLRLNSVPLIVYFGASRFIRAEDVMTFHYRTTKTYAEYISEWMQVKTHIRIRVFRPTNYAPILAFSLMFSLGAGFLYIRGSLLIFLCNKQIWATLAIGFCFAMVSGQIWNHISDPPFFRRTENGPMYIEKDASEQFVIESYFIASLNAAVVVGLVLMIEAAGGVKQKAVKAQAGKRWRWPRLQCILGLVMVCVFFSLLLSVFYIKTGYPYSFLFVD